MKAMQLINSLQNLGFRITPARKELIRVFVKNEKPMSADYLLGHLHRKGLKVNKTTVYREIDFLQEQRLIQEIYINPKKVHYESAYLKHHHHLVCNDCGTVTDVVLERDLSDTEKVIEKEKGFKIENHSLEFFGLCVNCQ